MHVVHLTLRHLQLPTFVYPISYTLIDTFLVVFIKATSSHGKTSYNTITVNAITEFIKLCIAIYIAHGEGSLHTLRSIVTDPGLMIRFAIPNLLYAVNNNVFHYSIGALPPAVFVVAINAFRTVITAILQPCVSNQALTGRQIIACMLLMLSFVFASLPEVIKVAFSGAIKGSILESLVYLASIYSIISVIASLAQEKLLKDSKSLMVANIINYSIGITFQVSGMMYEKVTTPDTDLFRGLDVFWVRAIPVLMALVGLSISYVLKYYDNIVKLLCSSVSVLLVNTITAMLAGDSMFNVYFLVGWLMTFPATYLYYIAPQAPSNSTSKASQHTAPSKSNDASASEKDDEETQSLLEPKTDSQKQPLEISSGKKSDEGKSSNWFEHMPRDRMIIGGVTTALIIFSVLTSTFDIEAVEEKTTVSTGYTPYGHFSGIESVEETCSLFEVPFEDSRSNLRVVESFHAKYGRQYTTVDYVNGDVFVTCPRDIFVTGPDSAEFRSQLRTPSKDKVTVDGKDAWYKVSPSQLEDVTSWDSVFSLYSVQRDGTVESKIDEPKVAMPGSARVAANATIVEQSRLLLQHDGFKRLSWTHIDNVVGPHSQYVWIWCSDFTDANLIVRPPVSRMTPEPPQPPLKKTMQQEVEEYVRYLSAPMSGSNAAAGTDSPVYDTVLVLYLDAISRVKFEKFFQRSRKLLDSIAWHTSTNRVGSEADFVHNAVELKRLHAVGINSEKNYPQFLSGVSTYDTKRFYHKNKAELEALVKKDRNLSPTETWLKSLVQNTTIDEFLRREPWMFDVAQQRGFVTASGVTNCPGHCHENCHDLAKQSYFYEQGGFHAQYMIESDHRLPGQYNFPTASYCESRYRATLLNHACSTCDSPHMHSRIPDPSKFSWTANKLGMSYVLDWWRVWLASTAQDNAVKTTKAPRFGVIVLEETHQQEFLDQFDIELANFLHDILYSANNRRVFGTERLAMVVMADHGLHFTAEFKVPSGKIANKQPFGYVILPPAPSSSQVEHHRQQMQLLQRNALALTTSFDLRATILYWLTGREWSADALDTQSASSHHHQQQHRRLAKSRKAHRPAFRSEESSEATVAPYSVATAQKYREQVFASQYGLNLMTSVVPFNRSCDDAGIPADFCGCNLQPCEGSVKRLVHDSAKSVVNYINRRIKDTAPQTLSVCKPLHVSELIFVPGLDDCLASSSSIVVNAYVQRNMKLISITYVYDKGYSSSSSSWHPGRQPKLRVANVNTISNYGKIWSECRNQFAQKNITHSIPDDSYQFCYCVDTPSWISTAAGVINALNF